MTIKDFLLPEFDHEVGTTRKLLERVPLGDPDWKPHAKSMSISALTAHIVTMLGWVSTVVNENEFDVGDVAMGTTVFKTMPELLAAFDQNVAKARGLITARTDAELLAPWTLKRGGQALFTVPKVSVLRTFLMNHLIHHRGQLSVYLRMLDVRLPSIYGPSADEKSF